MKFQTMVAAAALSLVATAGLASPAGLVISEEGFMVDEAGMTVYVFDLDEPNVSYCEEDCVTSWMPVMAEDGAGNDGDFTVVHRSDGDKQWAYKSRPLYYWIGDAEPGDVTGESEVWHVVE